MHTPVFHDEVLQALDVKPGQKYIDGTAGEGGHLSSIAHKGGIVLGLDYDANQIEKLKHKLTEPNITLVHANFRDIHEVARKNGFSQVDGILLDLGLSMQQLSESGKGLSFKKSTELLSMQIHGNGETASEILNTRTQAELKDMFERNAEEIYAGEIAELIAGRRKSRPFAVVGDLVEIIERVGQNHSWEPKQTEQTMARIFQALRMEVNEEIANVRSALQSAEALLLPGGKLVIITFHSLEDRIVKQWGRTNRSFKEKKIKITKFHRRSFERSAQLRVYIKQ
jgi:16S rRNA (cytosine1402-N4)-methyltransferase